MGQNVRTYASHQAFCERAYLGLDQPVQPANPKVKPTPSKVARKGKQSTSQLLPGFIAWFVDGMRMETRAGRWY